MTLAAKSRGAALLALMGLVLLAPAGQAQTSRTLEFDRVWNEIQELKASDQDIPADLYSRYFELEQELFPERGMRERDREGTLDQGMDACPGLLITQPAEGSFTFSDAGQTYNSLNDCRLPSCRNGRDLIYALNLVRPTWLQISTCGSNFDTYLCVFADSCCPATLPLYYNDDNPALCGTNSLKAAISACFFEAGLYYIVLDGYNSTASGHYVFTIQDIPDSTCGTTPTIECPADFAQHVEGLDEAVCENGNAATCGSRFCGEIGMSGDLDVFGFTLTECSNVTISVFANATPGRSGFGNGLDPNLRLYGDPGCDFPIYWNNDFDGTAPEPVGQDSRIATFCLRPGSYWVEVSGQNTTTGLYELMMDCVTCPPAFPITGVTITHPVPNRNCAAWPEQSGNPTYYVWRALPAQEWVLVGTTYRTTFCENLPGGADAQYQVFDSPCGTP